MPDRVARCVIFWTGWRRSGFDLAKPGNAGDDLLAHRVKVSAMIAMPTLPIDWARLLAVTTISSGTGFVVAAFGIAADPAVWRFAPDPGRSRPALLAQYRSSPSSAGASRPPHRLCDLADRMASTVNVPTASVCSHCLFQGPVGGMVLAPRQYGQPCRLSESRRLDG